MKTRAAERKDDGGEPGRLPGRPAICFDLDGVLIDTMMLHAAAWQAALRDEGLSVSKRLIYAWEGEPGRNTARRLLQQAAAKSSARDLRAGVARILANKEQRFALTAANIRVAVHWRRFLARLRISGVPLALVTGTSRREVERVVPRDVLRCFRVVVTGDSVAHGKPHPEPYRTACRRLRIEPRRAIVLENAPYGIRSAKAAGIGRVVALASSLPASFLKEADVVCATAAEARRCLGRMLTGNWGDKRNEK